MTILVPNSGEVEILKRLLNYSSADNLRMKLFTSNTTPAEGDTVSTYTEASGNGYADKVLTGSNWTIATDGGGISKASYAEQTFAFTGGPVSVYGYFVTNNAGTVLLWAERFTDGPYNLPSGGGSIKITPSIEAS